MGNQGGLVSLRGREGYGHWTVPWGTDEMGGRQPPLPHAALWNILTCHRPRTVRDGTDNLLRLLAGAAKAGPEADISAIQLVGPKLGWKKSSLCTSKCTNSREYWGHHLESQSYWRRWCLPSKATKGGNKRGHQKWQWNPDQQMSDPQRAEPLKEGGGKSQWKEANVREAHQKALAMVVTLKEEIEWLSCPLVRSQPEAWVHSKSRDWWVHGSRGQKRGTPRGNLRTALPPTLNTTPPEGTQNPVERQWLLRTLIWRSLQNWGQRSPAFSEGQPKTQKRKKKRCPLPNPQWRSSVSG